MGGVEDFCGSEFWNLTESPKFTECFEKTALAWTPCVFLWLFAPLDIYFAYQSKCINTQRGSLVNTAKFIMTLLLTLLSVFDECYYLLSLLAIGNSSSVYPVDIVTPVIKTASFILVILLCKYSYKKGVRSSGTLFAFWFLMLIFGLAECHTKLTKESVETYQFISYIIYYMLVLVMFILNCFMNPPVKFYSQPKNVSPEVNATSLSKIMFAWYDSFIWLGYKRPLVHSDLWDLEFENSSSGIIPVFEKHWNKELEKTTKALEDVEVKSEVLKKKDNADTDTINYHRKSSRTKQASLIISLAKSYGATFMLGSFMKLMADILTFVSPQILSLLMKYTDNREEPLWRGIFYASLLFATAVVGALFLSQCYYRMHLIGFRIRTSLTSAIFKKVLRISNATRKEFTMGEIVNFMSVDIEKIVDFLQYICCLWSSPFLIFASLFFLWKYLGPSVLAGLTVMIILAPINLYIASKYKVLQINQMKNKDKRVKLLNEVLNGMKVLKLYAWEFGFEKEVSRIREKELRIIKKRICLKSIEVLVFVCAQFLISLASFAVYVLSSSEHVLDSETVFVSITLFTILRIPITILPTMISTLVQAIVSIKRIQRFLNSDELTANSVTHEGSERHQLLIENGTFTWGGYNEEPVLRNINLRMDKGALVAVVGTVGAGKSSLISALLGEMTKVHGKVNTKGSIAYVAQQAWIQNATLRNNITFGSEFDKKLYDSIIESCALTPDFDILPARDETEIGEKGINLSGGQKQRINLARAIYSDAENYFLDDPLSAVDSHVGKHIFERVIGPNGLLKNKTRILVTHSITYLPDVDTIIVLKDGTISEIGNYEELLARKGAFADFLKNHIQEVDSDTDEEELNELKQIFNENTELGSLLTMRNRTCSTHTRSSVSSIPRQGATFDDAPKMTGENLIETEKVETGNIEWKVYFHYFSSIGLFLTASTILFGALYQALDVGINLCLATWTTDESAVDVDGKKQNVTKRNFYLGVCGLIVVGLGITGFLNDLSIRVGCWKACRRLHNLMLHRVMRVPMNFMDVTPIGRIIARFSKDIDVLDNHLVNLIADGIYCIFVVLSTLFVISFSTPAFLTVILPIGVLYYMIQRLFVTTSRQLKRLESVSRSPVYSHFGETIQGVQSVRAYAVQERFIKENEQKVDSTQKCYYPSIIANRWSSVRLEIVGNLIIFFAALFAVLRRDYLNSGVVGLSVGYSLQVTRILSWLVSMMSDIETNIVAVERVKEYEEVPQEADWQISGRNLPINWPDKGVISFENLQIRYREGLDLVLKGLTFTVYGGEKVGIVGRTGAGKSSLTLSLFRIIEPAGGRIVIDGVDITSIGLHTLRSKLTIIPQDPVLFSGSLRINMDPLNEHSDESIWSALKMAGLISHISSLERGLQYEVTEGGDNFSVGQRQLICLARALLRKTKILILDEATAAVDLETDDLIQRTIRSEFKDCTVLTIAHRLNTIMDSDRVIVLDNGVMVEYDSPEELLKKRHSYFYKMANDAGII